MMESTDPKLMDKIAVRCAECDREKDHFNTFIGPDNVERNICWECTLRAEKGFFTKRDFRRGARHGYIPR